MILWHDLKYGIRQLHTKPGFTVVAVLTLALGIGVCTAVFSVVHTLLFRPMPLTEPERLMKFWTLKSERHWNPFFPPDTARALREQTTCFEDTAFFRFSQIHLVGGEFAEELMSQLVTPNIFKVLGVKPMLGRPFLPDEGRPGRDNVVVISYHLWQKRFGGDPRRSSEIISTNVRPRDKPLRNITPSNPAVSDRMIIFVPWASNSYRDACLAIRTRFPGTRILLSMSKRLENIGRMRIPSVNSFPYKSRKSRGEIPIRSRAFAGLSGL
ncbi:MAG: ABC transporter permease [Sedimentisphaerales bacterium]|nr:ABC transporter permease [Sedimentisphaerales bacterium]